MSVLRKLRLHLEQRDGTLRNAAQIFFTGSDASLYLVPYAPGGEYFYGQSVIPAGQAEFEINFREQVASIVRPKLSVHESGSVHVYASGSPKAGPVFVRPLPEARGEHIATVSWDRIDRLPINARQTRIEGPQRDYAFGVPDDVEGGALLLYANGERNLFLTEYVHFAVQVERGDLAPVFFGVTAVAREAMGATEVEADDAEADDPAGGGVSILAGFDARQSADDEATLLYVRGL
jgi:hypothetical protein